MIGRILLLTCTAGLGGATAHGADTGPPPPKSPTLRIVARIDGVDELRIAHREATWTHLAWSWPTDVSVNGQAWNPTEVASLSAPGERPFVAEGTLLGGATLRKLRGRGPVELDWSEGALTVRFEDGGPVGADVYEVQLTFAGALCADSVRYFAEREDEGPLALEVRAGSARRPVRRSG